MSEASSMASCRRPKKKSRSFSWNGRGPMKGSGGAAAVSPAPATEGLLSAIVRRLPTCLQLGDEVLTRTPIDTNVVPFEVTVKKLLGLGLLLGRRLVPAGHELYRDMHLVPVGL